MKIDKTSMLLDGGSIVLYLDDGREFWIDKRIETKTKYKIFYPHWKEINDNELINDIIEAIKKQDILQ